jgi:hypothetical protein
MKKLLVFVTVLLCVGVLSIPSYSQGFLTGGNMKKMTTVVAADSNTIATAHTVVDYHGAGVLLWISQDGSADSTGFIVLTIDGTATTLTTLGTETTIEYVTHNKAAALNKTVVPFIMSTTDPGLLLVFFRHGLKVTHYCDAGGSAKVNTKVCYMKEE